MLTDAYGDPLPPGALARVGTMRFGLSDPVSSLAFAPDSKNIASGGEDCSVRLWDSATGKQLRHFGEHPDKLTAVAFSRDGTMLVSGSRDGHIRLWEVANGRLLWQAPQHGGAVFAFAFSNDNRQLVTAAADHKIRFWDLRTGREARQLDAELGTVHALAFAPDGKNIATGSWESTVRLCDLNTGKEIRQFNGHRSWVQAVAFSPDGRTLASGSGDETIRLWEIASSKERLRFPGHKDGTFSLAFAPDGKSFASAGADGTILVWSVTGQTPDSRKKQAPLLPKQLEALWTDLGSDDAARAFQTIWALVAAGQQALGLIKTKLPLAVLPNAQRVSSLLGDLDHEQLARREKATAELEKIGALCAPALKAHLKKQQSTEVRRRLERLLEKAQSTTPAPDTLLTLRVIETLELCGLPEAIPILQGLVKQLPGTMPALDAKLALARRGQPVPPEERDKENAQGPRREMSKETMRLEWPGPTS